MQSPVQLTFINDNEDIRWLNAENAARHRHSMFTDIERQNMSLQLVSSVPNQNLNRAIVELERLDSDSRCADLHSSFRGPFGAFRLQTEVQTEDLTTCQNEIDLSTDDWFGQLEDLLGDLNTDQPHFTLDLADMTVSDSVNHELTNLHIPQNVGSNADEPRLMPDLSLHPSMGNIEGWCLISHYKDRIIPLISPWRRGQETPWMSLIIPCATTTLSELTLNETANHARLALLNAVWSTSAFHLANATTGCLEQWRAPAECYLKRARSHFQKCMEESCTSTVKMSKYKEILMAILSLSNVFMMKGDPEKRREYLVQTEKLICIKGLSQPKLSTKKRALHHCYAYMRIMAETTCIANKLNMNPMEAGSVLSEAISYGGDFRIHPNLVISTSTMTMEKDPEMAQRDLHLAIPGRWSSTLFPTVYGVDEIFLMLLSQVIRLANERDLSMTSDVTGGMSLKDFWTRAKALERAIDQLVSTTDLSHARYCSEEAPMHTNVTAQAMYSGLCIFFYRRVYEIDPAMLQDKVTAMRAILSQIQEDEGHHQYGSSAALIWPAFIAACEAVEPELQEFFSSWFECCARTTALIHAAVAKRIFEGIWIQRRDVGLRGEMCSWPDVLRDGHIRFTCV